MTRKHYQLTAIDTCVSKFLRGLHARGKEAKDYFEQNFICENCEGNGKFTSKRPEETPDEECSNCNGTGIVKLSFTIQRSDRRGRH